MKIGSEEVEAMRVIFRALGDQQVPVPASTMLKLIECMLAMAGMVQLALPHLPPEMRANFEAIMRQLEEESV